MESIRKFPVHPQEKICFNVDGYNPNCQRLHMDADTETQTEKKTTQVRGNFKKQLEKKKNLK